MKLPLGDVRVLTVEQYGAGPFGTQYLADQGAEVIKIESPSMGGGYARAVGPHFFTDEHSQFFHSTHYYLCNLTHCKPSLLILRRVQLRFTPQFKAVQ